jgi:hypothetical protein
MTNFPDTVSVAKEVIAQLLRARDFLGYQLSHANGGMTDEQLEEIAEEYLDEANETDEQLAPKVAALLCLIGDRCGAEVVGTVFRCTIEQAARVLAQIKQAKGAT